MNRSATPRLSPSLSVSLSASPSVSLPAPPVEPSVLAPAALTRRGFVRGAGAVAAAVWTAYPAIGFATPPAPAVAGATSTSAKEAEALHVLNRLAYGPAPGDAARVMEMGIDRYIEQQLEPKRITQSKALTQSLEAMKTLSMSQRDLIEQFREAERAARKDGEA